MVAPDSEASSTVVDAGAAPWSAWVSWVPTWPLWITLAVFGRLLIEPRALLNDPDTYLHIAAGRWIWGHFALPTADPFSYTMAGARWVPGEWLAEAVLAGSYAYGGWSGVVLLSAAGVAVSAGVLARSLIRSVGAIPAVMASLAAAALVFPHAVARAHVLAMPLLVLWSASLLTPREERQDPPWVLLPAMFLWANLHASFLFGIGLAGWRAVEAVWESPRRRAAAMRWGGFVAASVAAGMVTPNGVASFLQPLRLMEMPALQTSFGEWLPPNFSSFPALELWVLAAIAVGFGLRARLSLLRLALLLLLFHMALRHVRHADLLGLVGPLVLAGAIGEALTEHTAILSGLTLWRGAERLVRPFGWRALAVSVAIASAAALPLILTPLTRSNDKVTPRAALTAARDLRLSGPVFNSETFGGYLAFAGVPDFIDGRVEMFGNDFLAADVAAERGDEAALSHLLARYGVRWTLLAPEAGAVAVLDRMPGWRRVYADPYAVIHVRVSAASGSGGKG